MWLPLAVSVFSSTTQFGNSGFSDLVIDVADGGVVFPNHLGLLPGQINTFDAKKFNWSWYYCLISLS